MEYGETFEEMMERTEAESRAREASEGGRGAARGRGNISKRFSVVMQTVEGGSPAEFIRDLSAEEIKGFEDKAKEVHNVALQHWDELQPYQPSEMLDFDAPWGTAHREAGELRKAGTEL